jgi:hypothetical protein
MAAVAARVTRLGKLSMGLHQEMILIGKGDDPLLYLERRAYLMALQGACSGLESARVILARARQRLERSRRPHADEMVDP